MSSLNSSWVNWAGNQSFACRDRVRVRGTADITDVVREAAGRGETVRAAGSGHSFTPIVQTAGTLLDISELSGIVAIDPVTGRATIQAGTALSAIGAPLWEAGLSLANQGDIDRQTLAGAVATGTKGSGVNYGTLSSTITGVQLVDGRGEVIQITDTDVVELRAAQVSLGLLGVMTQIEVQTVPRYFLREENRIMHVDALLEKWDDLKSEYRHFSFWWMPTDCSAKVYELPPVPADHAFVKLLQEVDADPSLTVQGEAGNRTGRAHLIYPDIELGTPTYELEYVLDASRDKEGFLATRDFMMSEYPSEPSPVQVRWQRADEGFLSPQYQRDGVSISVSGIIGTDWEPFLRALDARLNGLDARPHWGKIHFLTRDRVAAVYPQLAEFNRVREGFDPHGVFLNDQLANLIARAV